jgi:hypothetical protein
VPARPKRNAWAARKKIKEAPVIPPGTPIASFPGFTRLDDGKSRIFVEVSKKVEVVERHGPARLVYRLRGTSVTQRTNGLPLITGFFNTPVERVQLVQNDADVDVVIDLREATEMKSQVIETPRGMVLWIDFPKSASFGREDGAADAPRPAPVRRSNGTQRIGAAPPSGEDLPPPPMQSN